MMQGLSTRPALSARTGAGRWSWRAWGLALVLSGAIMGCSPASAPNPAVEIEGDPPGAGAEIPAGGQGPGAPSPSEPETVLMDATLPETYQADPERLAAIAREMEQARDGRYLGAGAGPSVRFSIDDVVATRDQGGRGVFSRPPQPNILDERVPIERPEGPDRADRAEVERDDRDDPALSTNSRPPSPVSPPPASLPPAPVQKALALSGRMAWHAPAVMVTDQPYFLSAAVGALAEGEVKSLLDSRLAADIMATIPVDPSQIETLDLKVYPRMKATLSGAGFVIDSLSEAEQAVEVGETTRWLWSVRPRGVGRQPLALTFSRTVEIEGRQIEQTVRTFPRVIDIRSPEAIFLTDERARGAPATASAAPAPASAVAAGAERVRVVEGLAQCRSPTPGSGGPGRLALVIANQDYTGQGVPRLEHALSDGREMSGALAEAGFSVTYCENLSSDGLTAALGAFRERLKQARAQVGEASAVFYYSGHGATTPSRNQTYLLPVSLRQANASLVESQGLSVDQVVGGLASAGAERLVFIFDACRDVLKIEGGVDRGFNVVSWRTTADDIIAYATRFGEKAKDNGLYARSLAQAIREASDPDAVLILNQVQKQVSDTTGKAQIPDFTDRMPDRFSLRPASR